MIFARRTLQRLLDDLRSKLDGAAVGSLATRLNRPGKDRLAAMWELVVFDALARQGNLLIEGVLASGRRPDVAFRSSAVSFIADIASISDDGLDEQNPVDELRELLEGTKRRLGLGVGGLNLRVHHLEVRNSRGTRIKLRLPHRKKLQDFIRSEIEPKIREQIKLGEALIKISIRNEIAGLDIIIDPKGSSNSIGSFPAYDNPTIKDQNPLYGALTRKAEQLRAATGLTGIIACDGDSVALSGKKPNWNEVDAKQIVREFLRQHFSVDFVVLISVRERKKGWSSNEKPDRNVHGTIEIRHGTAGAEALETVFRSAIEGMPMPVAMPVNGARRAKEPGYGWGHHGGYQMDGNRIKISSRALMELLAGRRSAEDTIDLHGWNVGEGQKKPNHMTNPFEIKLRSGRLPTKITAISTGEDDCDDWIEFDFGAPDSAISPFK